MNGVQTTLQANKIPELEEFRKRNWSNIRYVLDKYNVWKELKEREGANGDEV